MKTAAQMEKCDNCGKMVPAGTLLPGTDATGSDTDEGYCPDCVSSMETEAELRSELASEDSRLASSLKFVKTSSGTGVRISRSVWESIGKKAGWLETAGRIKTAGEDCVLTDEIKKGRNASSQGNWLKKALAKEALGAGRYGYNPDMDYGPSSPYETTLEVVDPEDGLKVEVKVLVHFSVETTEYEGGYLFYQGGIVIDNIELVEDVQVDGKEFPSGTSFDKLIQYYDGTAEKLEERLSKILEKKGVQTPVKRYRGVY